MVKDRGLGLPLLATADDFTSDEIDDLPFLHEGDTIQWRGAPWTVVTVIPLLVEEVMCTCPWGSRPQQGGKHRKECPHFVRPAK